jgi:hypothetical protein
MSPSQYERWDAERKRVLRESGEVLRATRRRREELLRRLDRIDAEAEAAKSVLRRAGILR